MTTGTLDFAGICGHPGFDKVGRDKRTSPALR